MDSKGNVRSANKPEAKAPSSGKAEKPNPSPATNADKKELPKEQPPAPAGSAAKKPGGDPAVANNHSNAKASPAATEAAGQSPDSEHKGNGSQESPGGIFDSVKPLLVAGGVAVAALAVIVGVAFLARKK
ncbi:cell cycle exit and neuronal differentiation protein 1 [Colius striatus]|uniref:cell cycle exit and neuronal differentiation protein 1 n=1 Tax=Colius striatus TaxID=57412 RepID=UPI002B1E5D23|nr:cell cycle exit and neuronal differentiation protein 1 [Colius striatus]XP_061856642.1 cell cycle exit and neuronal differentiation protein 1 [Colius striatus]